MEFVVCTFKDENTGRLLAIVPDIPDCITQGDSYDEIYEDIEDVAELCLEDEALPSANSLEYFTADVLDTLSIPHDAAKKILLVQEEEDEHSYSAELVL